jgi:hypothetical protein
MRNKFDLSHHSALPPVVRIGFALPSQASTIASALPPVVRMGFALPSQASTIASALPPVVRMGFALAPTTFDYRHGFAVTLTNQISTFAT